eukprot:1195509-Prorocentrum_minimum.AAC.3
MSTARTMAGAAIGAASAPSDGCSDGRQSHLTVVAGARRLAQVLIGNIRNTERYVNMSMASKRNVLIRIDVLMNMATFSLACGGTIAVMTPCDNLVCDSCSIGESHMPAQSKLGARVSNRTDDCRILYDKQITT